MFEPFRNVQTAVSRKMRDGGDMLNPAEQVSAYVVLSAIPPHAGWQLHSDDHLGSLEVGKAVDVVDQNPFEVDPKPIAAAKMQQTCIADRAVLL